MITDRIDAALLIGGQQVDARERIDVANPADGRRPAGSIVAGTMEHVEAAARAANEAFASWSKVPFEERAARLREAAQALAPGEEARAALLVRENGQTLAEATSGVRGCRRTFDYYATVAETFGLVEDLPSPNGRVAVRREPMGVAVLIVPWNAPTRLGFLGLAPILLAGNTVIVKPPTESPLALIDALETVAPFFPPGTINVVTGRGETVGRALVSHPAVRKINFTGSTEAGKEILRLTADSVKRVSLELGGNDPAVVLADADLDAAIPELVRGTFGLSGQMCYDVKRIYVEREVYSDFVSRFAGETDKLVVGNGLDPRSRMGPLINAAQRRRLQGLVDAARADGATVETLGHQLDPGSWDTGFFELPAVVTGATDHMELVRIEQFGPAIPIMAFDTVDEAVERANGTQFGLAASVWSRDEERAFEIAGQIQAGTSFVNVHRMGASGDDMPFGGFKESGLGRSHGVVALEEQFELHTISSRRPPG